MTTIIFERISWILTSLTETLSKLRFSGVLQRVCSDYQNLRRLRRCSNINQLPEDCLVSIFSKLDQKELINCAVVCKQWKFVLDFHPELYHNVRISLKRPPVDHGYHRRSICNEYPSLSRQQESNRGLVQFLINRSVTIRRLAVDWCFIDQFGFDTLGYLLSSSCCRKLKKFNLNWSESWNLGDSAEFDKSYEFFLSVLVLLKKHCDSQLRTICTQFNWTADSVKYMSQFNKLKHLEIQCVPRVHCVQKWHIDKLMSSLSKLEHFKMVVTILPKLVQKYSFKSESLVVLDISDCVNMLINDIELPCLKYFKASNLQCHRMGVHLHQFCLLDTLMQGCPMLCDINGNKVDRHAPDFGISVEEHQKNKICFCPKHNFKVHMSF